jgi:nitrite reductase (NO-forming)
MDGTAGDGEALARPPSQEFEPGPEPQGQVTAARDATLPPLGPSPLDLTYRARDITLEIAAGVQYNSWTFDDLLPGPVLHVKQGDVVNFTLINDGAVGHSMDFHSARTPWDKNYITIVPGDSISFQWTADFPGVYMYHCGTPPVLHHIGNGMYGAVVVDPDPPLPPAREYVLVQSEFYARAGEGGTWDADLDKMKAVKPDLLAFNGKAFQYQHFPLPASVGELIRLYVMNAGPTLFSAFHVIGTIFDRVYVEGNPANELVGISTYTVAPGQGCTFELTVPEAGLYPFVTHSFAYTELGAVGLLEVT